MTQSQARLRAKDLGGIAVSARPRLGGGWTIGGWPMVGDEWIVTDIRMERVLDDRPAPPGAEAGAQ